MRFAWAGAMALAWGASGCGLLLDLDPADDASIRRDAGVAELCANGADDDGDGALDCLDPECATDASCLDACDGADDDADSRVDENDPAAGAPCFDGDPALAGIGACVRGVTECRDAGLACVGSGAPSPETCDGIDDDCDGELLPEEGTAECSDSVVTPSTVRVIADLSTLPIDVHTNLDATGSMLGVIDTLRSSLTTTIEPRVRALMLDAAFGFSTFEDFPFLPFGGPEDSPFTLRQRVTTDLTALQLAIEAFAPHAGGGDGPEAGVEALHQIATGAGVAWTPPDGASGAVPAIDCGVGFDASRGHGRVGGACFRAEAMPVVVHVTDAESHDGPMYGVGAPAAASFAMATAELSALGAHVVGVVPESGITATPTLPTPEDFAIATGTTAPLCAFDGSIARALGTCTASQCCTGVGGAGRAPVAGVCPIVFHVPLSGTGAADAAIAAIEMARRFAAMEVAIALADDPSDAVDARCFVQRVEVALVSSAPDACVPPPAQVDTDGDGVADVVRGATAATTVTFDVALENRDARDVDGDGDRAEACAPSGDYRVSIGALAGGHMPLAMRIVTVTVP